MGSSVVWNADLASARLGRTYLVSVYVIALGHRSVVTGVCGGSEWALIGCGHEARVEAFSEIPAPCQHLPADTTPARWPQPHQRRGTNYGLRNSRGEWLFLGENIAGFRTFMEAADAIADQSWIGGDHVTFRRVQYGL